MPEPSFSCLRIRAIDRLGFCLDRHPNCLRLILHPVSTRILRVARSCLVVNRRRMHMLLSDFGRIGFDPFLEMRRMQQEMNQRLTGLTAGAAQEFPPVNLWVGEDSVAVTAELPGIAPDEVDLTVRENTLTLKCEREPRTEDEKSVWHRRERAYGSFSRTVQLPFRVDPEQVEARFANGLLEVELRRPEADRPKKIQIKG
ncbi:Hsp20/alpha crystallin family protein [Mesorhizobium sp. WSM2239]|uniref:Hsp20/alpha crystallin family protein n=2 Tax=unclassified Mesorhizobium TaxID=325217 RepID=A0AAU8DH88_9HYPH